MGLLDPISGWLGCKDIRPPVATADHQHLGDRQHSTTICSVPKFPPRRKGGFRPSGRFPPTPARASAAALFNAENAEDAENRGEEKKRQEGYGDEGG